MRRLKLFFTVLLVLLAGSWITNQYLVISAQRFILTEGKTIEGVEVIVVPGASVHRSGELSPVLRERVAAGLRFHRKHSSVPLLFSGHSVPQGYNEPLAMAQYARLQGVHEEKILLDPKGTSTYFSLLNCRDKFKFDKIVIVTQAYHLPRAIFIARSLKIEAYGIPTVPIRLEDSPAPFRELVSRIKDFILIHFYKLFL